MPDGFAISYGPVETAAAQLTRATSDIDAIIQQCRSIHAQSQAAFVGAAATAYAEVDAQWQLQASEQSAALTTHVAKLRTIVANYQQGDGAGASRIGGSM